MRETYCLLIALVATAMFAAADARALRQDVPEVPLQLHRPAEQATPLEPALMEEPIDVAASRGNNANKGKDKGKDYHSKGASGVAELKRNTAAAARIAAKYGKATDELDNELITDSDLAVDIDNEGILYVCEGMAIVPTEMAAAASSAYVDSPEPSTVDAFKLHSRPGSTRIIYLDFDGHTATGSAWNGGNPVVTPAYDMDGVPGFSTAELASIVNIWRAVADDYAAFDVDVTTEYPGSEDKIGNSAGTGPGMRVAIGGSGYDWYGSGAGGVAYVGTFGSSYYAPAYVFPAQLGNGYPKYVAEAISHEVGHTLGLSHDGTSTTAYYQGQGSWAPIMGVGYYKPITQWSKGEYVDANQKQDDVAIIRSKLGTVLPADAGSSMATATPMTVTAATATSANAMVRGVLDNAVAADFFSITAAAGPISITASVTPSNGDVRANLDLTLTLLNANGVVLATVNPSTATLGASPSSMGASLTYTAPAAGVYYLSVVPTGEGDPATTGYSSYGSLGQYTLTASYAVGGTVSPSPPPPSSSPSLPPPSPSPSPQTLGVSIVTLTTRKAGSSRSATVSVRAVDSLGRVVPGATVTGRWSFSAAASGWPYTTTLPLTAADGTSTQSSKTLKSAGTFTFAVMGATAPGYMWDRLASSRSASVA